MSHKFLFHYSTSRAGSITIIHCPYSSPEILCARLASAAAKSNCPAGAGLAPGLGFAPPAALGLEETGGAGGLGGSVGPDLVVAAGAAGLGFAATGGGLLVVELGVVLAVRFHGVADPSDCPAPGKTETGFADALAVTDCNEVWVSGAGVSLDGGGGRRGGAGAAAAALGFGGTYSR